MFKNVIMWILTNIFHIQTQTTDAEIKENSQFAKNYEQIENINFNAIFSNKLANYTVNESEIEILGDSERAKSINKTAKSMWKNFKKIIAMAYGYGGIVLVPYVQGGKIYYSKVAQDRLTIDNTEGDLITGATILAEKRTIQSATKPVIYMRWTNYQVKNGNMEMLQQFTNEEGKKIPTPEFWKNIPEKMTITDVDRCLFGYIKSPQNNRKSNDKYGVPITYGCDGTISEIKETMKQLADEYELKKTFVGVDALMFNGDNKLPSNGLFKKINTNEDDFFQVYDPAFRSYLDRLEELYRRLEAQVGTNGGILSQPTTQNATATEIRRAMYDTFSLIDSMRANIEAGLEDFIYACNVLSNAYNITPQGDYDINYEWTNGLIEDSTEDFNRLMQAHAVGAVKTAEIREWLKPEETLEESQAVVDEIKAENPSIQDLLGSNVDGLEDNEADGEMKEDKKKIKEQGNKGANKGE